MALYLFPSRMAVIKNWRQLAVIKEKKKEMPSQMCVSLMAGPLGSTGKRW